MTNTKQRIFYGWFLLVGCWLLTACTTGMFVNTMNQFVKPVCEALDISRTQFSVTTSCISMAVMLISPFVGKVFEKFNPRLVVTLASVVMIGGWFGFSFVKEIELIYLMGILIGVGSGFCGAVVVNIILNNWFRAKKGFVMGFASTGSGFGSTLFNPIAGALITKFGYEVAVRYLGVIAIACVLPIIVLFVYKPEYKGLLPYGEEGKPAGETDPAEDEAVKSAAVEKIGMTRNEAIKSPKFWGVCFIAFSLSLGAIGLFSHMTPYFTDMGYKQTEAALFVSIISLTMAISKIVIGWLNDKLGTFMNFTIIMIISVFGMGSLLLANSRVMAYVAAVGFGIAFATTNVFSPLITVHAMGEKDFSNIFGLVSFAIYVGPLVASPLSGAIYDSVSSYRPAVILYTALYAAALLLGFFVLRKGYGEASAKRE